MTSVERADLLLEALARGELPPAAPHAGDPKEDLIEAALAGRVDEVRDAITCGVDVDAVGTNGETALMCAATYGRLDVLRLLLDCGADPDQRSETLGLPGATALMIAAATTSSDERGQVVRLLLERGAGVDRRDAAGRTALHHAIAPGRGAVDAVDALIRAGADIDARDADGYTALMRVVASQDLDREEGLELSERLLGAGASDAGLEAIELERAARRGDLERVVELLGAGLSLGRPVDAMAVRSAARSGHAEVVRVLVAAGADPDYRKTPRDLTSLMEAAYYGHLETARVLLEAGADVRGELEGIGTALEYARMGRDQGALPERPWTELIRLLEAAA